MSDSGPTTAPTGATRTTKEEILFRGEEDDKSSEDTATQRTWSGRKGKPKTRTGCVTCKIRRIKCDESKPFCSRCLKTGRVCDGYVDTTKKPRGHHAANSNIKLRPSLPADVQFHLRIKFKTNTALSIPQHPLDHPGASAKELRAMEFFRYRTSALLSNWLVEQFWRFQLPQVSDREPAIRHALISLSATHEAMEMRCGTGSPESLLMEEAERKRYACLHYNEGVSQLAKVLRSGQGAGSEIVAMITGALFVILKFMWGDFATAVLHMHNEIEIFDVWRKKGGQLVEGSLEHNLTTLIERQCFKSMSIGDTFKRSCLQDEDFYDFGTIGMAKEALLSLLREALRLIRVHSLTCGSQDPSFVADFQSQLEIHRSTLRKWLAAFEPFVYSSRRSMTASEEMECDTLRVMHISAYVWLYAGMSPQTSQAEPIQLFEKFIDMGEALHSKWCSSITNGKPTLSCDTGIVPPLIFISTQCSSSILRTRANNLLIDSSGIYQRSSNDIQANLEQPVSSAGMIGQFLDRDIIEVEIEPGTLQVDLVLQPNRSGGWEVQQKT